MTSFSFHAQVAAEAIEKVGRLFNASIDDILNELLQNARRAGAAKVLIDQIEDPRFGPAIRIIDDGAGLDDPRSLFSLGKSEWSKALSQSEDAAGMGFFSLANRGAMIVAGQKGTEKVWTIAATPDAFHGKEPVTVDAGPEGHRGLTVIFPERKGEHFASAVRHAVRFFPVPVIFNGEEMPSSDFLDGADHVEEWQGIRIGVFGRDLSRYHDENVNFHGVTLKVGLPVLQQSWHRSYFARIDVVDCAHLKLVLPARKDIVRDAMYAELMKEITRLYFRMIAASLPEVTVIQWINHPSQRLETYGASVSLITGKGIHHATSEDLLNRFRSQARALEPPVSPLSPNDGAPAAVPRSFTVGEMETALCIWEAMLYFRGLLEDQRSVPDGVVHMSQLWDAAGWQAMRAHVLAIIPLAEQAYTALSDALDEGGFTFDFDFIPAVVGALDWTEYGPYRDGEPEEFLETVMSAVAGRRRDVAAEALASDKLIVPKA